MCADHPVLPSHNNTSELRLRQAVTERKKNLFAGYEGGAASAAILCSIVANCGPHGLDPWAYIYGLVGRINETLSIGDGAVSGLRRADPVRAAGR